MSFLVGAIFGGAVFELAIQYGLLPTDFRFAGVALLSGGIVGTLAVRNLRKRRHPKGVGLQTSTEIPVQQPTVAVAPVAPIPALVISPDGGFYWTSTGWQPIALGRVMSPAPTAPTAELGPLSPDGLYYWDGSAWHARQGES
jgi:hypothetical protein